MDAIRDYRIHGSKPKRKLAVTVAVSAPIIFWMISLFGCFEIGKEKTHVQ